MHRFSIRRLPLDPELFRCFPCWLQPPMIVGGGKDGDDMECNQNQGGAKELVFRFVKDRITSLLQFIKYPIDYFTYRDLIKY